MNAPSSDTGTVHSGISVARQLCRKTKTTRMTSASASSSVTTISRMPSMTGAVLSRRDGVGHVGGEARARRRHRRALDLVGDVERVRSGELVDGDDGRVLAPL